MNTRELIKTTALTSLLAVLPFGLATTVDAGVKIKIKPQTHVNVNVKPKVKIAPKVKVKSAKIRIKVKPRASKQVAAEPSTKIQAKKQTASKSPRNASPRNTTNSQPIVVKASYNSDILFDPAVPTRRPNQNFELGADFSQTGVSEMSQARAAAEAARMLDQIQELAALGSLRDAASVEPGVGGFDIDQESAASNSDLLGPPQTGGRGSLFEENRGPGADEFAVLENTHSSGPRNSGHQSHLDAVNDYYDINRSIGEGIAGIAGQRRAVSATVGPWVDDSHLVPGRRHREEIITYEDGGKTVFYYAQYPNGTGSRARTDYDGNGRIIREQYNPSSTSSERGHVRVYGSPRDPNAASDEPPKIEIVPRQADKGGSKIDVTKLYDPDSGYGGTSPFPWINEREKPTADLSTAGNGKTPGGLTQVPESAQASKGQTQAAVATNDVLENWDEDGRNRNGPTPVPLCVHSECP